VADKPKKTARVTAFFGDGEHVFTLQPQGVAEPLALIEELQEKTGVGPYRLFKSISDDDFRVGDIREVLRLSLIGGGKSPSDAHKLVSRYFDKEPIAEYSTIALDVMVGMLFGHPVVDDPLVAPAKEAASE
jgi:hypothetical protein